METMEITSAYDSNLMAYYYVINLFTLVGIKVIRPVTYGQLWTTIIIIAVTQYLTAILARVVASHLVIKYSAMSSYEYVIQELQEYVKSRELSPSILSKMWEYLLSLWFRRNGQSLPKIIQEAPSYLRQDIMYAMYGKHLENHQLFGKTHVDFLRQLVCHLRPLVFFPGNTILDKSDVDGTMYFMHSGEVEVYDIMGRNENLVRVLSKGMTFGEVQGLFNEPHQHSYRAATVCDILMLRRCDWFDLLKWFPASWEQIMMSAMEAFGHVYDNKRTFDFQYETTFTF